MDYYTSPDPRYHPMARCLSADYFDPNMQPFPIPLPLVIVRRPNYRKLQLHSKSHPRQDDFRYEKNRMLVTMAEPFLLRFPIFRLTSFFMFVRSFDAFQFATHPSIYDVVTFCPLPTRWRPILGVFLTSTDLPFGFQHLLRRHFRFEIGVRVVIECTLR